MARTYTVQSGDSLAKIAERFYGSQRLLTLLVQQNGGSTLIRPGDVLRIPKLSQSQIQNWNISEGEWGSIVAQDEARGFRTAPSAPAPGMGGADTGSDLSPTASGGSRFGYRGGGSTTRLDVGPGTAGYGYFRQYIGQGERPYRTQSYTPPPRPQPGRMGGRRYTQEPEPAAPAPRRAERPAPKKPNRFLRDLMEPLVPIGQSIGRGLYETGRSIKTAGEFFFPGLAETDRRFRQSVAAANDPSYRRPRPGVQETGPLTRATRGGRGGPSVSPGGTQGDQQMTYEEALALVEQTQRDIAADPNNQRAGLEAAGVTDFTPGETFRGPYVGIDWSFPPWDPRHRFLGGAPDIGYPDYMIPGYRSDWARIPETPQAPAAPGYGGGGGGYGGGTLPEYGYAPGGYRRQGEEPTVAPGRPRGQYGYGGGGGGGAVPFRMPGGVGAQRAGITALVSWTL